MPNRKSTDCTCPKCLRRPIWREVLTDPHTYVAVVAILCSWWLLTAAAMGVGN